ncbi:MAG: hypothetical protein KGZ63_11020 [Clostridiales bacterium]|jgi:hypothetical protein|nr:hypothetical protein [Clostridiales bacterium]
MIKKIGIAGTAKNTGKTTATMSLISRWPSPASLAVTSIGYDGEEIDNVTNLPKPRLHLTTGSIVVTAEKCLNAGSAVLEKLEKLELQVPLGSLFICRVRRSGLVVLAGPNSKKTLEQTVACLDKYNVRVLLVDGALNRLAPMGIVDGLIIATGASRNTNIEELAQEAQAIEFLLNLPQLTIQEPALHVTNLLIERNLKVYSFADCTHSFIEFSGMVDIKPFTRLTETLSQCPSLPGLVFSNPIKLLLCGDLLKMSLLIRDYCREGGNVGVRSPLSLLSVTINPFYPLYNKANREFVKSWLDADEMWSTMSSRLKTPVVDVVRQGEDALYQLVMEAVNGKCQN